jgi:diketogulonate reductase-like aldo/keto reductase
VSNKKLTSEASGSSEKLISGGVVEISSLDGKKVLMPLVGFGTYKFKGTGAAQRAVTDALRVGYRHIDTAFCYGGEKVTTETH